MTEIVSGELRYIEETKNAHGGTELMARRMVRDINPKLLDGVQIIHSRVRTLEPGMKRILVCHDLPNDPEVAKLTDPEYRKNFDKIVFVSHHQQHMYNLVLGVPFSESLVIPNAVEKMSELVPYKSGDPIRMIYHTTPHRGLNIVAAVYPKLREQFNVELDVYSSFLAYGWKERDAPFQNLFDTLETYEGVRYHGYMTNEAVRSRLTQTHIFGYPSIWTETSCIALIEAMMAGNISVHSSLGALPETSRGMTMQYMFTENSEEHAARYLDFMVGAIQGIQHMSADRFNDIRNNLKLYAERQYDWNNIIPLWVGLLEDIR